MVCSLNSTIFRRIIIIIIIVVVVVVIVVVTMPIFTCCACEQKAQLSQRDRATFYIS